MTGILSDAVIYTCLNEKDLQYIRGFFHMYANFLVFLVSELFAYMS